MKQYIVCIMQLLLFSKTGLNRKASTAITTLIRLFFALITSFNFAFPH